MPEKKRGLRGRRSDRDEKQTDKAVRAATAWHPPFYDLVNRGAPPTMEVRTEVVLSQQPRRADLLLLRRKDMPPRDHEASVLRGLWPLLGPVTLAEFTGPTAGFRSNDLPRLLSYGMQYHSVHMQALAGPADLTLALLTPGETPSLRDAVAHMGWRLERLDNGYARIVGAWYTTVIAFIDDVCEAERDDYRRLFSRHEDHGYQALWCTARAGQGRGAGAARAPKARHPHRERARAARERAAAREQFALGPPPRPAQDVRTTGP